MIFVSLPRPLVSQGVAEVRVRQAPPQVGYLLPPSPPLLSSFSYLITLEQARVCTHTHIHTHTHYTQHTHSKWPQCVVYMEALPKGGGSGKPQRVRFAERANMATLKERLVDDEVMK